MAKRYKILETRQTIDKRIAIKTDGNPEWMYLDKYNSNGSKLVVGASCEIDYKMEGDSAGYTFFRLDGIITSVKNCEYVLPMRIDKIDDRSIPLGSITKVHW